MPPIHNFSAPSKESVHVALLALSLLGNERFELRPLPFYPHRVSPVCHVSCGVSCCVVRYVSCAMYRARLFFNVSAEKAGQSVDELAIDILQKKMNAYERFNAQYPGYGGTITHHHFPPF
jgi:hypothetical protein